MTEDVFASGRVEDHAPPVSMSREVFEGCIDQGWLRPKVVGVSFEDFYGLKAQYPELLNEGVCDDRWRLFVGRMPFFDIGREGATRTRVIAIMTHPGTVQVIEF